MAIAIEGLLVTGREVEGDFAVGLVIDAQVGLPPAATDVGLEGHETVGRGELCFRLALELMPDAGAQPAIGAQGLSLVVFAQPILGQAYAEAADQ
ncbi:hypothetical protein D3C86_1969750 [compost metagenome]